MALVQDYPVQQYKNLDGDNIFTLDSEGNLTIAGALNQLVPGRRFFVDATSGSDTNDGTSPSVAFATITEAIANAVSGRGDIIEILPGSYDENVVLDKDYVTLLGPILGGYSRPDIVPAAGIGILVSGQGCSLVHIRVAATAADCVVQQGNGFNHSDCVFDGDGTANKAGLRYLPSSLDDSFTASEGITQNCLFRGNAIGIAFDTGAAPVGVGSTDNSVLNNKFIGNTLDITAEKTGAGGDYSVQGALIEGNQFVDKNKATYIDITTNEDGAAGNQTGAINGNTFASDTITTTKIKMVGTGFTFSGNYYTVGIADGSGLD